MDLLESLKAAAFAVRAESGARFTGRRAREGFQPHAADIEVFLEAIGLEQVGEFEGADVAAAFAHFALEVGDHLLQVLGREAGP